MLKDIEKCTDERLGTIYWLAKEGIKWAKNHPQLKEITRELKNRGLIYYGKFNKRRMEKFR